MLAIYLLHSLIDRAFSHEGKLAFIQFTNFWIIASTCAHTAEVGRRMEAVSGLLSLCMAAILGARDGWQWSSVCFIDQVSSRDLTLKTACKHPLFLVCCEKIDWQLRVDSCRP
ncbi:hypothetical protein UB47_24855 [Pseudomonas sp. 5]|nr:hypothetical protein UB47_24855 [Pseudomonas sp. 5]